MTFYSTGCPKCRIAKMKLDAAHVQYDVVSDVEEMTSLGIETVPYLKTDDGDMLNFDGILMFINKQTKGGVYENK